MSGRLHQFDHCRGCGYPVPADQRCPECELTQTPVRLFEGSLNVATVRRDARVILLTGMAAPAMLVAMWIGYVITEMLRVDPLIKDLVAAALIAVPPLAMLARIQTLRNTALLPWWSQAITVYAVGAAGYALAWTIGFERMIQQTSWGTGWGYTEYEMTAYEPLTILRLYGLLLVAPTLEQLLLCRTIGIDEDAASTRRTLIFSILWPVAYVLTLPLIYVIDSSWTSWLFLGWTALGSAAWILLIMNGMRLLKRADAAMARSEQA